MENPIERIGVTRRWSDAVVHNGTAYFVDVADDPTQPIHGQVRQILNQIEARLRLVGSDRTRLLQVLIYLANLADAAALNSLWDDWVPAGHAPARACVQAGLAPGYLVEMVITAAIGTAISPATNKSVEIVPTSRSTLT
jgi:enamine deaminase RidA (YjgF/YER057c/UK114 family)